MTAVTPAATKRLSGMRIVRAGLALMWVVWAALAWWSAPRAVSSEQLDADLAAGRITSYQTAESWEQLGGPDPVRGTRWFWFWIGQLPFGVCLEVA